MPSLKVHSKMFAGEYEGALVVKVGRERAEGLIAGGLAGAFDPRGIGRPMKDWVLVPQGSGDWMALAEEAKAFVAAGD